MEKGNGEEAGTTETGTTTATTEGGGGPSEIADQRQESSAEWTDDDGNRIRKTNNPDGTTTTEKLDEYGLATETQVVTPRPDGKFDVKTFDADQNEISSGSGWDYDFVEGRDGGSYRARMPDDPKPPTG